MSSERPAPNLTGRIACAADLAAVVDAGYNGGVLGPISIVPVTLTTDDDITAAFLVTLTGIELVDDQATDFGNGILASLHFDNAYLKSARAAMQDSITPGATVIIAGHSLGGIIAQQLAAHKDVKSIFQIKNVVTFGAPVQGLGQRAGEVRRLGHPVDPAMHFSALALALEPWNVAGTHWKRSPYRNPLLVHMQGYQDPTTWSGVDALGRPGGTAQLVFDPEDRRFYPAPPR